MMVPYRPRVVYDGPLQTRVFIMVSHGPTVSVLDLPQLFLLNSIDIYGNHNFVDDWILTNPFASVAYWSRTWVNGAPTQVRYH